MTLLTKQLNQLLGFSQEIKNVDTPRLHYREPSRFILDPILRCGTPATRETSWLI